MAVIKNNPTIIDDEKVNINRSAHRTPGYLDGVDLRRSRQNRDRC